MMAWINACHQSINHLFIHLIIDRQWTLVFLLSIIIKMIIGKKQGKY